MIDFSDYIVFVDESGDHGMESIDSGYPIFVLTFCVFNKEHYCNVVLPKFNLFKMKWWGHNNIVLHEAELRRPRKPEWYFLNDEENRNNFMEELNYLMSEIKFFHLTTIVDKNRLTGERNEKNIYEFALLFCMERLDKQLRNSQNGKTVDIIIEGRGNKEDRELELEFRRILDGEQQTFRTDTVFNSVNYKFNVETKQNNTIGLQIADLIARPIGINFLRPQQSNQAYEIIKNKNSENRITGHEMMKVYP